MTDQPRSNRAKGNIGEDIAAEFLLSKGYHLIERNHYTNHTEIDIIALSPDEETVVFVEVKSRDQRVSDRYGRPASAVGVTKQKNIIHAAQGYMKKRPDICSGHHVRIDVIEVYFQEGTLPRVRHIRSAVTAKTGYNR